MCDGAVSREGAGGVAGKGKSCSPASWSGRGQLDPELRETACPRQGVRTQTLGGVLPSALQGQRRSGATGPAGARPPAAQGGVLCRPCCVNEGAHGGGGGRGLAEVPGDVVDGAGHLSCSQPASRDGEAGVLGVGQVSPLNWTPGRAGDVQLVVGDAVDSLCRLWTRGGADVAGGAASQQADQKCLRGCGGGSPGAGEGARTWAATQEKDRPVWATPRP